MSAPGLDRITQLRIRGLRTFEDVTLHLNGLAVVIGANGVGKTSLVEACAVLKKVPSETFLQHFNELHGGIVALIRRDAPALHLGVDIGGAGDALS